MLLVQLECGHTNLVSKNSLMVLPHGDQCFMISDPVVGKPLLIRTTKGRLITSPVVSIVQKKLTTTVYIRVTTQNSVFSLISYGGLL